MPKIVDAGVKVPQEFHQKIIFLLKQVLERDCTDKCTLQVFEPEKQVLHLIAQAGFKKTFLSHFKITKPFDSSACGRAIGVGNPIVVSDVTKDMAFVPHLNVVRTAGYRAVKSIPLFTSGYNRVGVISTHFPEAKWTWDLTTLSGISDELAFILARIPFQKKV